MKSRYLNKETLYQFIRFCIVGVTNVAASFIGYYILLKLTGIYLAATIAGYIAGMINAYFLNTYFVFKVKRSNRIQYLYTFLKMTAVYSITGIGLNYFLILFWVKVVGISEILAPVINSVIFIPINFVLNKIWSFKPAESDLPESDDENTESKEN